MTPNGRLYKEAWHEQRLEREDMNKTLRVKDMRYGSPLTFR